MFRSAFTTTARTVGATSSRSFHSSPIPRSATGKVADVANKVNLKVGQGLASAIETGEKATEKTKETLGVAQEKASEASEVASQEVNKKAAEARQRAHEFKDDAQRR